jgi:AcrR family transcriptional regulator
MQPASTDQRPRERIVRAAYELLQASGREAATTRAVSAAADVQPPTIYRQFGDMRGLLDAAANHGFAAYLDSKRKRPREADPVDDLRRGWDLHVEFGLAQPAVYALLYGEPRPEGAPAAVTAGLEILRGLIQRIAEAGRLRLPVDRAMHMVHAACKGVTLSLLATPAAQRDSGLAEALRETLIAAITTQAPQGRQRAPERAGDRVARHAVALKASLAEGTGLSPAEAALMADWLDRLARQDPGGA